jgi:hypothetical protein
MSGVRVNPDDWMAIHDVQNRYARGVDRRDWALVRSCYHPEATDNHGAYTGGVDGLIEWMQNRHESITSSMHFIGNVLIEPAGQDNALVETYALTIQRVEAQAAGQALAMYGLDGKDLPAGHTLESEARCRFVDRMVRAADGWLIQRRTTVFDSLQVRVVPERSGFGPDWAVGRRDTTDPLYAERAALW